MNKMVFFSSFKISLDQPTLVTDRQVILGIQSWMKGNFQRAIKLFTEKLKYSPTDFHSLLYRGDCYRMSAEIERAIEDFNHALKILPQQTDALARLACCYQIQGDFPQAFTLIEQSLTIKIDAFSLMVRALTHRDMGKIELCIIDIYNALTYEPDNDTLLLIRANTYFKMKQYHLALLDYKSLSKKHTNDLMIFTNMGRSSIHLGNIKDAIESFSHALTLAPTNQFVLMNLGEAYRSDGNYEAANDIAKRLLLV